jgi:hypothetical protein
LTISSSRSNLSRSAGQIEFSCCDTLRDTFYCLVWTEKALFEPPWPPPRMFATCWTCPLRASPDLRRRRKSSRSDQVREKWSTLHGTYLTYSAEGITRELYALLGERAPPIAINENKYKGRPKFMNKLRVRKWLAFCVLVAHVTKANSSSTGV